MKAAVLGFLAHMLSAAELPFRNVSFGAAATGRKLTGVPAPTSKRAKVKAARKAHLAMRRRVRK